MKEKNYSTYLKIECRGITTLRLLKALQNLRNGGLTEFKFEKEKDKDLYGKGKNCL